MKKVFSLLISAILISTTFFAQETEQKVERQKGHYNISKFKQLQEELPTPDSQHTASGAPGYEYTQQKVDYKMDIILDDENQRIYGEETITYHNNSTDALEYLWLQLDQNMRAADSKTPEVQSRGLNTCTPLLNFQKHLWKINLMEDLKLNTLKILMGVMPLTILTEQ